MEPNSPQGGATTIPSELNGLTPRRICSSPTGIQSAIIAVVVVILALAGTSWLAMNGVRQLQDQAALRRDGIEASGQVTRISHSGKSGRVLRAHYSFTVNGTDFSGEATIPKELEQNLRESSTLSIRYLPASPEVNYPAAWEKSNLSATVPLMAPLFPIAIGISMLITNHRDRRLLAEGLPAIATITKAYYNPKRGNGAHYEFRTREGEIGTGSSLFEGPQTVGSSLCILYLPQNSKRNIPYPVMNYRIAD